MIHMGLLNIIRRMALREKESIREISRRTGLSRNTHGQTHRNCQVRIFRLATTRFPPRRRPLRKSLIAYPDRQITASSQTFIIRRPIRDFELLFGYLVPPIFIELMRHQKYPATKDGRLISAIQGPMQQRRPASSLLLLASIGIALGAVLGLAIVLLLVVWRQRRTRVA
jgi:hypothetical protein